MSGKTQECHLTLIRRMNNDEGMGTSVQGYNDWLNCQYLEAKKLSTVKYD